MLVRAFILAKNEEANIARSVSAVVSCRIPVTVLDSGSADRTSAIAASHGATVESYEYRSHADAYEDTCLRCGPDVAVIVLDADMILTRALVEEGVAALGRGADVVEAPVSMCWNGVPLRWASLCPPKAFLLRGGATHFVASGHGERPRPGVKIITTRAPLLHDDRKPFDAYLASQARYARNLVARARAGQVTVRDKLRSTTPVMLLVSPVASYLGRGGILDGWSGLGYALDRVIAEAIMFRESIAARRDPPR